MYCPECRDKYRDGVTQCDDCGAHLVEELPPAPAEEPEWRDTSVVFETSDPSAMMVAKSILESAEIPFLSVGDRSQDLIGLGRLFAGSNPILGQMRIEVPREYRKGARRILRPLANSEGESPAAPKDKETSEA
jgi:hypothetical protein